jgi:hypothetical protein
MTRVPNVYPLDECSDRRSRWLYWWRPWTRPWTWQRTVERLD